MESGGDAEEYRTVAGRGRATIEIRGSEFIGHVAPVDSVEDAEAFVADVREAHPEATHNVPAYRVRGANGLLREHSSDEGEPSGTAGTPTLTVLQRRDVEDVAVVVTRYFGGTELGVGGLARAYGETTKRALDGAGVIERVPHRSLVVEVAYDDSGTVRGILESETVEFEADYSEQVRFDASVPTDEADHVADRLRSATSGRADVSLE